MKQPFVMKKVLLLLIVIMPTSLFAQGEVGYKRSNSTIADILPPSPEAKSVVKYAGVPFTHSLGAAEYIVPLYELKGREITVPINLHYCSNGIKVDEIAGVAGLGWNLEAGGCVTREVIYMPDEYNNWQFYTRPDDSLLQSLVELEWSGPVQSFIAQTMWNRHDVSADRYKYCVQGHSGTFIILPTKEIVQLSGDGVKIQAIFTNGGQILGFRIIGPDGQRYSFMESEVSTRKNQPVEFPNYTTGQQVDWNATTAWYLTSILSADASEEATFVYASGGVWHRNEHNSTRVLTVTTSESGIIDHDNPISQNTTSDHVESECATKILASVNLRGTQVSFSYTTQTTTTKHKSGLRPALSNYPKRLSGIAVMSPNQTELVRYDINTVREQKDGRIILQGINQYRGDELTDRWTFTYSTRDFEIFRWSQDWFGFYNKENLDDQQLFTQIDLGLPDYDVSVGDDLIQNPTEQTDIDRPRHGLSPFKISRNSTNIVRAFGLPQAEEADYMSMVEANHDGARTLYEYEGAYIGQEDNSPNSIGLRVKSITVKDGERLRQYKHFIYENPAVDGPRSPDYEDFVTLKATDYQQQTGNLFEGMTYTWVYSIHEWPVCPGLGIGSSRAFYGKITEKIFASPDDTTGVRTVYTYDTSSGRHSGYYVGDRFPQYVSNIYLNAGHGAPTVRSEYYCSGPVLGARLTRKDCYRLSDSGSEELYESEEYEYQSFGDNWILVDYRASDVLTSGIFIGQISQNRVFHFPVYAKRVYGDAPSSVLRVGYHASGNDTTRVYYSYLPRTDIEKPIREEGVSIAGSDALRSCHYEYPDTRSNPQIWVQEMVSRHRLLEPIRDSYYIINGSDTTNRIDRIKEFGHFVIGGNNLLMRSRTKELYNGVESWSEEIQSRDQYGNVTMLKEKGRPAVTIGWGYNGLYPIRVTEGTLTKSYEWSYGVGITKETGPSGRMTLYDYDNAGRLVTIRNTDGNALEEYSYSLLNTGDNLRSISKKQYLNATGNSYLKDVFWWNTLGEHLEDIEIGASTQGRSLVHPYGSDFMLHDNVYSWLPVPYHTSSGQFVAHADSLSSMYHQNSEAYHYTGYELSSRDIVRVTSLPGYRTYSNTVDEDVRAGCVRYAWTEDGVVQQGEYPSSEVVASMETDPDGRVQTVLYDRFGKVLGTEYGTDEDRTTSSTYVYDNQDRLRAVFSGNIDPSDTLNMWRYSYDALGRLASRGIPGSVREFFTYDNENRIIETLVGDEIIETIYDANGRVVQKYLTKGGGIRSLTEKHWYDSRPESASELLQTVSELLSDTPAEPALLNGMETYTQNAIFDEDGAVSGYSFTVYKYDKDGNVVRRITSIPEDPTCYLSEEYRYNFNGALVKSSVCRVTGTDSDRTLTTVTYDSRGRKESLTTSLYHGNTLMAKDSSDYEYDALGRLYEVSSVQNGGVGVSTMFSYTLQGFLQSKKTRVDSRDLFEEILHYGSVYETGSPASHTGLIASKEDVWYTYDIAGNRHDNHSFMGYWYDSAGRISQAAKFHNSSAPSPLPSQRELLGTAFSYDAAGNMTGYYTVSGGNRVLIKSYLFDGHKLSRIENGVSLNPVLPNNPPIAGGVITPIIDWGDIVINPGTSHVSELYNFTYDERGRMMSNGAEGVQFAYNPLGLTSKVIKNNASLVKYSYLAGGTKISAMDRIGEGLLYYGPLVFRRDTTGFVTFESAGIPSGRITPEGARYHVTDHLGSVRAVVDGNDGSVLECSNYSEYGERSQGYLSATESGMANRYHYIGHEDQQPYFNASQTDFGARHYAPVLRRWTTPDPLSEENYSLSPYAYCASNPINFVDDNGESYSEFDEKGRYLRTIEDNWLHNLFYGRKGRIIDSDGQVMKTFRFADPKNDVADLKNGSKNKIVFVKEEEIMSMLSQGGAFNKENKSYGGGSNGRYGYVMQEGIGGGKLDFSATGIITHYVNTERSLFLVDEMAHNDKNYGNFLFGAAGTALGLSVLELLLGAHLNSLFNSKTNGYGPQLDSIDDQTSIFQGIRHAERRNYRNMYYQTKAGPLK